jgi:hypothetical protein
MPSSFGFEDILSVAILLFCCSVPRLQRAPNCFYDIDVERDELWLMVKRWTKKEADSVD